jgi:hypothetical protein
MDAVTQMVLFSRKRRGHGHEELQLTVRMLSRPTDLGVTVSWILMTVKDSKERGLLLVEDVESHPFPVPYMKDPDTGNDVRFRAVWVGWPRVAKARASIGFVRSRSRITYRAECTGVVVGHPTSCCGCCHRCCCCTV